MFCIKSSFVVFFIAFYIEGESTQVSSTRNCWCLMSRAELCDCLIESSPFFFSRLTVTFHGIKVITKSLNTFWHELIISFTDFGCFSARLDYVTDFLISFVMINYNVFDMLYYVVCNQQCLKFPLKQNLLLSRLTKSLQTLLVSLKSQFLLWRLEQIKIYIKLRLNEGK